MTVLAYPCIGGPLDGEWARVSDFVGGGRFLDTTIREAGMYEQYAGEYTPYDWLAQARAGREGDFPPTRVYLHQSILRPTKAR